ncbi:MAG: hypothetical protein Kow00104_05680 [Rhodothalassiaceae bacterium]
MRFLKRLLFDDKGSAAVEFGLAIPAVIGLSMGVVEIAYIAFAEATLEGSLREAARAGVTNFAPEGTSREDYVLGIVLDQMNRFNIEGETEIKTRVYDSFSDVGRPEPFIDQGDPPNGVYDEGECFSDINQNGVWDSDMGAAGLGGSGSVVVYEARIRLRHLTPVFAMFSSSEGNSFELSAATAVRNEPFSFTNTNLGAVAPQVGDACL